MFKNRTVLPTRGCSSILTTLTSALIVASLTLAPLAQAADHNDPNGVNSIFHDVKLSAADLYDIFGFPSDDTKDSPGGEKVIIALTFAPVSGKDGHIEKGKFDPDLLYRVRIYPGERAERAPTKEDRSVGTFLKSFDGLAGKFLHAPSAEVRVTVDQDQNARVSFIGFPSGDFSTIVKTNEVVELETGDYLNAGGEKGKNQKPSHKIKAYLGARDDAFFNDLPGFFRSINYGPQFYHVNVTDDMSLREFATPKSLLEIEGNTLFNVSDNPRLLTTEKIPLPEEVKDKSGKVIANPRALVGAPFKNFGTKEKPIYRLVYTGDDAQAGRNINAIILEIPLSYITTKPEKKRIVNTWGESWVKKAKYRVNEFGAAETEERAEILQARPQGFFKRVVLAVKKPFVSKKLPTEMGGDQNLGHYRLIDTDGQAFSDAALSERYDRRQLGAANVGLGIHFVSRLAHLGWAFAPSIKALGLRSSFDDDNSPVAVNRRYTDAQFLAAFPRVKKVLFQDLPLPDRSWQKNHVDSEGKAIRIPLKKSFEIFAPNVNAIDMDTNGTWPFGRRPEDQVATRFLALFLDMEKGKDGSQYTLETLNDLELWKAAPVVNHNVPNPQKNDKEFLKEFPYLADPH